MPFFSKLKIKKGQFVFRQNEEADCAYIIESGKVSVLIEHPQEKILASFSAGEIFGEMAIIDGGFRSASARADDETVLTPVSNLQVQDRVSAADPIVRMLLMLLLKRVRTNNNGARLDSSVSLLSSQNFQDSNTEVIDKMRFEKELILALQHNQFVLHYQPIMNLQNDRLVGYEALIRWKSPERGLVPPLKFLKVAEETSLMIPIGKWVIEQATKDLKRFQSLANYPISMSVNVSAQQFQNKNFLEDLESAVQTAKVSRESVHLEITEGVMMSGGESQMCMQRLAALNYQTSLDDFGTGYSSLSYLTDWKFNYLKIDQSFVRKMLQDERAFFLCKTIVALAKEMQLQVIAEGIETQPQLEKLKSIGCHFGQGFLFSKALPIEQAEQLNFAKTQ